MITVILADDHTVLRDGLRYLLEAAGDIEILSMAANGQEAVEQATLHCPDVIVMDLDLPGIPLDSSRTPFVLDPNTGAITVARESGLFPLPGQIQAPR